MPTNKTQGSAANARIDEAPVSGRGLLAAFLGAVLFASLTFLAATSAQAAETGNSWQVVSRLYDPAYTTSEGLSSEELADHSFIESDDGQVRVTKTVEPTGVEDEFIVHLSVDTTANSVQTTDYKTFFQNAPYQATTSNGYHDYTPGIVTSDEKGTMDVQVSGKTSLGGNQGVFNIKDPQGRPIADNVTLYWSQANNVTILLKIGGKYIVMGVRVSKDSTNDLWLSEEAYKMVQDAIAGEVKQGDPTLLNGVRDPMGDDVEYLGVAEPDGGSVTYNAAERTLYWGASSENELGNDPIEYSTNCKKVVEDPVVTEERNQYGAVTKVTVTQRTWYYGAASLTYRVRLNTQGDGFASSYDPEQVSNPYNTNGNGLYSAAQLNYTYYTNGGESNATSNMTFPQPQVKGILYDLSLQKVNEIGTSLRGATFSLTRTWTDSFGERHVDVVEDSLVSDEQGLVSKVGLAWGTYTLVETAPPTGHTMSDDASERTFTFELCYTTNGSALTASAVEGADANHAMLSSGAVVAMNERVKTDVMLLKIDSESSDPIAGAKFALYADNGDGVFKEDEDLVDANLVVELETGDGGTVTFEKLTVGTYYLRETYTPAGYELNQKVFRIDVYDVIGSAGGSEDNMIRVGDADGSNMQPPNTANTVTVADRPIPELPMTAGPGAGGVIGGGLGLMTTGAVWFVLSKKRVNPWLRMRRHFPA